MSVVSGAFLLFLIAAVGVYYVFPIQYRWLVLLAASIGFYVLAGRWQFLPCIFLTTLVVWAGALRLAKLDGQLKGELAAAGKDRQRKKSLRAQYKSLRKGTLVIVLVLCIGALVVTKFSRVVIAIAEDFMQVNNPGTHISAEWLVMPLGISYYTFSTVGYILDVYWHRYECEKSLLRLFLYAIYFPHILQGPISRYNRLGTSLRQDPHFSELNITHGIERNIWGFFKKLIIADGCAEVVNMLWEGLGDATGLMLLVASLLFTFQIYADFSGYSDIAIGCAKLFGFRLTTNFKVPYFSRNVREFWRRWHITLMNWFTQYVYFPLGGSRRGRARTILNTIIVFALSGLWHGADWTFVLWGLYHALLFIPLVLLGSRSHKDTVAHGRLLPSLRELLSMLVTFLLVNFGWVLFRAPDFASFTAFTSRLFSASLFDHHGLTMRMATMLLWCAALLIAEWMQREREHVLQIDGYRLFSTQESRLLLYALLACLIFYFAGQVQTFIYFQF